MEEIKLIAKHTDIYNRVLETVDIVETLRKYMTLDGENGSYLEGKCPFDDKCGKSFCVSPEKKTFYCFGCHSRGNVIDFIAKVGNMNKSTAAKFLDNIQKSKGWEHPGELPKEDTPKES